MGTLHFIADARRKRAAAFMGHAKHEDICPHCHEAVVKKQLVARGGSQLPVYHYTCFLLSTGMEP